MILRRIVVIATPLRSETNQKGGGRAASGGDGNGDVNKFVFIPQSADPGVGTFQLRARLLHVRKEIRHALDPRMHWADGVVVGA